MFESLPPLSWCTWRLIAVTVWCLPRFRSFGFEEKYISIRSHPCGRNITAGTPVFACGYAHLLLNMFSLLFFGRGVETQLGSGQVLLIYSARCGRNSAIVYVHRHHDIGIWRPAECAGLFCQHRSIPAGDFIVLFPVWIPIGCMRWVSAPHRFTG